MASVDVNPAQSPPRAAKLSASPRRQFVLLSVILVVATLAVYFPVHSQPFANFDDADYVFDNFQVRSGLHWHTIKWAFTTYDAANWHPVTWLSHTVDTQIFGLDPAGPHDVNLAFHILNSLLLFWVLYKATGWLGRSWMVAALFALHPINVESVVWIAERKNLLSMFFLLLTLEAYRRYAQQPTERRYYLVAALFALGLMSKPQVITLPFVLLLWDYWPLRRFSFADDPQPAVRSDGIVPKPLSSLLLEKVPLLGLCLISAVLTMRAQSAGGATSFYPLKVRLINVVMSYVRYLGNALWPTRLSLFYPYLGGTVRMWQVAASLLFLGAVSAWVVIARRRRYLPVGWFWYLGTLVPMIGLVQVGTQAMADRYAYLPFIGIFVMITWGIAEWAEERHVSVAMLAGASAIVLLALMSLTYRQVNYWNDHITLWTHALETTGPNWLAENNLGTALLRNGDMEAAIPHFRAAAALNPDEPNVNLNIGTYEQHVGHTAEAIERYKKAAKFARNDKLRARAYNNLGFAYRYEGDLPTAIQSFEEAVKANPDFSGAWIGLGIVEQLSGDLPAAARAYNQGMQVQPSDVGYLLLSQVLEQTGRTEEARAAKHQSQLLSHNIIDTQRTADRLLRQEQ